MKNAKKIIKAVADTCSDVSTIGLCALGATAIIFTMKWWSLLLIGIIFAAHVCDQFIDN